MADETDLDLFGVFTVSSFSAILLDLDFFNELDLSNDLPLSDSFLMDLSFLLLDACGFFWVDCVNFIFCNGSSNGFLFHIGFCFCVINSFLAHFSVVLTNSFLEDMILVLDLLYPVLYKSKIILPENFN